jgi:hypothetical protein
MLLLWTAVSVVVQLLLFREWGPSLFCVWSPIYTAPRLFVVTDGDS